MQSWLLSEKVGVTSMTPLVLRTIFTASSEPEPRSRRKPGPRPELDGIFLTLCFFFLNSRKIITEFSSGIPQRFATIHSRISHKNHLRNSSYNFFRNCSYIFYSRIYLHTFSKVYVAICLRIFPKIVQAIPSESPQTFY